MVFIHTFLVVAAYIVAGGEFSVGDEVEALLRGTVLLPSSVASIA